MARQEEPREDLLREATALLERAEFRLPQHAELLVIGFRRTGDGSIYLGDDLSYQFNARGELRRGFAQGRLIKAEAGKLVALTRQRSTTEVALVRHDFTAEETAAYLHDCQRLIEELRTAFHAGDYELLRQQPPEADLTSRIAAWLAGLALPPAIAASPRAGEPR